MFINAHLVPTLIKVLPEIKDLELIIFDGEMESGWEDELRSARGSAGKGLKVVSIEEVERMGREKREQGGEIWMGEKAGSGDTYCLMYTSGSSECDRGPSQGGTPC
jgi:long-subunit acyl-CoA synthetase (AMP-forming)